MPREFRLPDLGEGIAEGQIVNVFCKEGDQIAEDQALMEVETDKAAVEIPSPFAGVASKVHVQPGQTVAVGDVLVTFEDGDQTTVKQERAETKATPPAEAPLAERREERPKRQPPSRPEPAQPAAPADSGPPLTATQHLPAKRTRAAAAPAVRKLAREMGVDVDALTGSGPGGRVLKSDVEAAARGAAPAGAGAEAAPRVAALGKGGYPVIEGEPGQDNWGTFKRQKLTQIRKTIAKQMIKSVTTIPHVTHHDEADVTVLEKLRRDVRGDDDSGPRVTLMAFVIKALSHCLRLHPEFNSTFDADNEQLIVKEYISIGVAVDSPRGLVVPVIRNVESLTILGIARELQRVAGKVRDVQFTVDELRGGTFTVTNYGAVGGIFGTPIINHPEVAVLGLGRTQERLDLNDEGVVQRVFLPLSLSFDHRAVDGAQAARFVNDIIRHLSSPGLLMLRS